MQSFFSALSVQFIQEEVVVAEGEQVQFCLQHSENLERDVDIALNITLESDTIECKSKFCKCNTTFSPSIM